MEHTTISARLLTAQEVANWLAVSPSWVRDHATGRRRPVLPSIRIGKAIRFDQAGIAAWIATVTRGRVA